MPVSALKLSELVDRIKRGECIHPEEGGVILVDTLAAPKEWLLLEPSAPVWLINCEPPIPFAIGSGNARVKLAPHQRFTYIRGTSRDDLLPLNSATFEGLFTQDISVVVVENAVFRQELEPGVWGRTVYTSASFTHCRFDKPLTVGHARFEAPEWIPSRGLLFDQVKFGGSLVLSRCEFTVPIRVVRCRFSSAFVVQHSKITELDLEANEFGMRGAQSDCGRVEFFDVTFAETVDMVSYDDDTRRLLPNIFHGPASFTNVRFSKGVWFGNSRFRAWLDLSGSTIAGRFQLPNSYWDLPWYRRGKECTVWGLDVDACLSRLFRRWVEDKNYIAQYKNDRPIRYQLWRIFTDCGRSLSLWFIWSLLFIAVFAGIFTLTSFLQCHPVDFLGDWHFSLVNFTELSFASVSLRDGWVKMVFVAVEKALGYGMLALLIPIFAHKVVRRS